MRKLFIVGIDCLDLIFDNILVNINFILIINF